MILVVLNTEIDKTYLCCIMSFRFTASYYIIEPFFRFFFRFSKNDMHEFFLSQDDYPRAVSLNFLFSSINVDDRR